jgi:hypothetical protein
MHNNLANIQVTTNSQQSVESKQNIKTDIQWDRQDYSRQQQITTLLEVQFGTVALAHAAVLLVVAYKCKT